MKKIILVIILMAISACAKNPYVEYTEYKNGTVVHYHGGGNVLKVSKEIDNMQRPIMIKGSCGSACTLAYQYQDTCVFPQSKTVFHAVWNLNRTISYEGTMGFLNQMPPKMRTYLTPKMLPFGRYTKLVRRRDYAFNGYQMHDMFDIPFCA